MLPRTRMPASRARQHQLQMCIRDRVRREDMRTVPPHVRYHLTDLGKSLNVALVALDRWAERHHAQLDAAARRHDAAAARRA